MYRSEHYFNKPIGTDNTNHDSDRIRLLQDSGQHDKCLLVPSTNKIDGLVCSNNIQKDGHFVDLLDEPDRKTGSVASRENTKDTVLVDLCAKPPLMDQTVDLLDDQNFKSTQTKKNRGDDDNECFILGKKGFVKVRRRWLRIKFFRVGAMLESLIRCLQKKSPYDYSLLERVNRMRKRRRLKLYKQSALLDDMARIQAEKMAQEERLYHSARSTVNLKLRIGSVFVGENIMRGPSEIDIFEAIMYGEAKHRENFLATEFTQMGTGSCLGCDGKVYMCHIFASQS